MSFRQFRGVTFAQWFFVTACLSTVPSCSQESSSLPPDSSDSGKNSDTKNELPPQRKRPAVSNPKAMQNSIGMTLLPLSRETFMMGIDKLPEELAKQFAGFDPDDFADEQPAHAAHIGPPIYLGAYEVTVGQFRQFVDAENYKTEAEQDGRGGGGYDAERDRIVERDTKYSWKNTGFPQTDEHPVVNVTWNDAVAFCDWLSRKEGKRYRLPTEAEWECACRGGTRTMYSNGDDPERLTEVGNVADASAKAKFGDLDAVRGDDGFIFTAPFGLFGANAYGFHDMHGNVSEWCQDWYGDNYYAYAPVDNPSGTETGRFRVYRGGAWNDPPVFCRSADRARIEPEYRYCYLGFRVACEQ